MHYRGMPAGFKHIRLWKDVCVYLVQTRKFRCGTFAFLKKSDPEILALGHALIHISFVEETDSEVKGNQYSDRYSDLFLLTIRRLDLEKL